MKKITFTVPCYNSQDYMKRCIDSLLVCNCLLYTSGSVLNYLLEHDFNNLTEKQLEELLKLANAAAAIVTTRKGVIRAIRCV